MKIKSKMTTKQKYNAGKNIKLDNQLEIGIEIGRQQGRQESLAEVEEVERLIERIYLKYNKDSHQSIKLDLEEVLELIKELKAK